MPWRAVLGLPTIVGTVGAVLQYGAIPFLTTYAVDEWGSRRPQAAAVLAVGRVVSILAKVVGGASTDRIGAERERPAHRLLLVGHRRGVGGRSRRSSLTYAFAAVFAGTVSSFFPVANMVAVEHFGEQRAGARRLPHRCRSASGRSPASVGIGARPRDVVASAPRRSCRRCVLAGPAARSVAAISTARPRAIARPRCSDTRVAERRLVRGSAAPTTGLAGTRHAHDLLGALASPRATW